MDVLFVCRGNNGRSQMAEAMFNRLSRNRATSAGVEVGMESNEGSPINPLEIRIMDEIGYDISRSARRQLTKEQAEEADIIVSMVGKDSMPDYLKNSKKVIYWDVETSRDRSYKFQVMTRDKIKKLVEQLVKELG